MPSRPTWHSSARFPSRGRGGRVGAADRKLIGRTVDIHLVQAFGGGPRVARAKVARDGSFRTTAKLPPRSVRGSNSTRYQARPRYVDLT